MRGQQERTGPLFSYISTEDRIPKGHPLRQVRRLADQALPGAHQKTLAADKGYDTRDFVADLRFSGVTPHVAQNAGPRRRSAIDGRTTHHPGYAQSINARKRIEQVFGWIKQAAGLRQLKARVRSRVGVLFRLHVVAYNLIRLAHLISPLPTTAAAPAVLLQLPCQPIGDAQLRPLPEAIDLTGEVSCQQRGVDHQ